MHALRLSMRRVPRSLVPRNASTRPAGHADEVGAGVVRDRGMRACGGHAKSAPFGTASFIVHPAAGPPRVRIGDVPTCACPRRRGSRFPVCAAVDTDSSTGARVPSGAVVALATTIVAVRIHVFRWLTLLGVATLVVAWPSGSSDARADDATTVAQAAAPAAIDGASIEGSWSWPVAPPHPVLRGYDVSGPYDAGHRGVDLGAAPGAAVTSPADGTVRFAGVVVDRPVLSITHDNGSISSFEPVEAVVAAGDRVTRGDVVGYLSNDLAHAPSGGLHLGARVDGDYRNPLFLLGTIPAAVLVPPRGG